MLNTVNNKREQHTVGDNDSQDSDYSSPTQRVHQSQSSDSTSPSSAEVVGFELDKEVDYDFTNEDDDNTSQVCSFLNASAT
jgi:hypothetical protein